MTAPKYYYNLNRCISDGKTQFDTTNMPKETYEVNGQIYHGSNDLMDLLNELHSRNKRLEYKIQRERNSFTKTHERWSKEAETKIKELSEENEHIKHTIKTMIETERTELGQSVLKQLWEQIE